jgi:CRP-like cAMP-binding protein
MSQSDEIFSQNFLLQRMPESCLDLLKPYLVRTPLDRRQVLVEANIPIEIIYFPEGGIASVVSEMPDTGRTEVGIFGREGVSGIGVLLGSDITPHETFMQVDGTTAMKMSASQLRQIASDNPILQTFLLRYVQSFLIQTAHSAISNAHHQIEARLARWLLMCHDRIDGDEVNLTHEFMSMMIAAQRTGVTVALHILEGAKIIRSLRGKVIILDREKLEGVAGDAYGAPETEYERLIGPLRKKIKAETTEND